MCFNENISLLTFLSGISGSISLATLKLIPESIFFGWVSNMQLIEYFLWKNQPCNITKENKICSDEDIKKCNNINQYTTTSGIIVNHLEPFIMFISILIFSKKILPLWLIILTCIFLIMISIYTINQIKNKKDISEKCTYVTKESNPHLYWQWNYNNFNTIFKFNLYIYLFFLIIIILLSYFGFTYNILSSLIILISYLISYIIYNKKKLTGSMWCLAAAFAPWILITRNLI